MPRRPFYVTLVGIYLLFFGLDEAWFLDGIVRKASDHGIELKVLEAAPVVIADSVLSALIMIACGIGVFRGANWARWLWTIWWMVTLIFELVTGLANDMPTAAVLLEAVTTVLLFLPRANAYFDPAERVHQ